MEIGTTSPRGKDMKRSMRRCSRLSYTWELFLCSAWHDGVYSRPVRLSVRLSARLSLLWR